MSDSPRFGLEHPGGDSVSHWPGFALSAHMEMLHRVRVFKAVVICREVSVPRPACVELGTEAPIPGLYRSGAVRCCLQSLSHVSVCGIPASIT
jgi:hypothetical protein